MSLAMTDPRRDLDADTTDSDTDTDDPAQVSHLVPESVKERAQRNTQHGELSEAVRDVYSMYASGGGAETLAQLEIQLRKAEREKESITEQLTALKEERQEVMDRCEELREQIREYEAETTKYERLMARLSADLEDGKSVFPSHSKVREAADVSGSSPAEVLTELRNRNPTIPESQFSEGATRSATDGLRLSSGSDSGSDSASDDT
jgi:chromosome segregation ATPase